MARQRSKDKAFIGWWAPADLRKRLKAFTASRPLTDTDALNEALSGYLDQNETTDTREQDR